MCDKQRELKVGDRVRLDNGGIRSNDTGVGVITSLGTVGDPVASIDFEQFEAARGGIVGTTPLKYYSLDRLTLEPATKFVNVTTARHVWITLPGDIAGHRLTEDEARQLLRELEEVV